MPPAIALTAIGADAEIGRGYTSGSGSGCLSDGVHFKLRRPGGTRQAGMETDLDFLWD